MPATKTQTATQPNVAAIPSKRARNARTWSQAQDQARTIVQYTSQSPVFGKTDLVVLGEIRDQLAAQGQSQPQSILHSAYVAVEELIKRKTARTLAGQTYRAARVR